MKVVALFDFCETIVKTQTIGRFCRYYLKEGLVFSPQKILFYRLINLFHMLLKKDSIWFDFFEGLHVDELNQFAEKYAIYLHKNFLIDEVVEKIKWHIAQKHMVIIVSAGLTCYIKSLAQKLGIEHVIAVGFECEDQLLKGKIDKKSCCYGTQKVERLHHYLDLLNEKKIDWGNSYAYTDHPSDMPLLNLTGKRFIVARYNEKISFPKAYLDKEEVSIIKYD